jgi:hypothetical protein
MEIINKAIIKSPHTTVALPVIPISYSKSDRDGLLRVAAGKIFHRCRILCCPGNVFD